MPLERVDPNALADLVVYADESGDHGLQSIDATFPVFALAFVIMRRDVYLHTLTPGLQRLKFDFWGHDQVVFHEREIRKKIGAFSILATPQNNEDFHAALSAFISALDFRLCVSVIDKNRLKDRSSNPYNPYEIALLFCMERLLDCLREHEQAGKLVHVVFESRGKKEDEELELEFRRITAGRSSWGYKQKDFSYCQFEPIFARKDANAPGLQLADLIARPCGLKTMRPLQENRAFETLIPKLRNSYKSFP